MTEVCLELEIKIGDDCEVVFRSVHVDDVDFPERVKLVHAKCQDGVLVYKLCCEVSTPADVLKLWSTVDDLIRNVRAALSAIS
jgi:hypothetical protein